MTANAGTVARYKSVEEPGHPLAGTSGWILLHRKLLFERIGPGWHPCHWCGEPVEWRTGVKPFKGSLVVDHVDHDTLNNEPGNLVPSCNPCNGHRLSGEMWDPWVPGTPTGMVNRRHTRCRKGHLFTPENVYINPETGNRWCLQCVRTRMRETYERKTPDQRAADVARNRESFPCPVCRKLICYGNMRRHIRQLHDQVPVQLRWRQGGPS